MTAVTFAIFFLVPRIGGASGDDMAARYVGKSAGAEQIHETAEKLGLNDPLTVQYGRFVKGLVAGADYQYGPEVEHCPAPCLGYSFINQTPVFPELMTRVPVTLTLALGAAVLWLVGGVSIGVLSALRRGSILDRAAMMTALAGVSLPIYFTGLLSLTIFSYTLRWTPGGGNSSDPMFATSPHPSKHSPTRTGRAVREAIANAARRGSEQGSTGASPAVATGRFAGLLRPNSSSSKPWWTRE